MGIGPVIPLIPLIGGTVTPGTPASGAPPLPQAHPPSLPQARGRTARPWNQLAREWATAEKKATARAGGRTRGSDAKESAREAGYPGYVGPDIKSVDQSLPLTQDTSGGNIPSSLLPLPTNIYSLGHSLPRRDGR